MPRNKSATTRVAAGFFIGHENAAIFVSTSSLKTANKLPSVSNHKRMSNYVRHYPRAAA